MEETPIQLSIPFPHSPETRIYMHLTVRAKAITLLVTTATPDEAHSPTPIGSFVYAMPDRFKPSQPLSTTLCAVEPTLEFTTRLAKLLARKTRLPTYVSNSISLAGAALGGTVEEETAVFKAVAAVVLARLQPLADGAGATNGAGGS